MTTNSKLEVVGKSVTKLSDKPAVQVLIAPSPSRIPVRVKKTSRTRRKSVKKKPNIHQVEAKSGKVMKAETKTDSPVSNKTKPGSVVASLISQFRDDSVDEFEGIQDQSLDLWWLRPRAEMNESDPRFTDTQTDSFDDSSHMFDDEDGSPIPNTARSHTSRSSTDDNGDSHGSYLPNHGNSTTFTALQNSTMGDVSSSTNKTTSSSSTGATKSDSSGGGLSDYTIYLPSSINLQNQNNEQDNHIDGNQLSHVGFDTIRRHEQNMEDMAKEFSLQSSAFRPIPKQSDVRSSVERLSHLQSKLFPDMAGKDTDTQEILVTHDEIDDILAKWRKAKNSNRMDMEDDIFSVMNELGESGRGIDETELLDSLLEGPFGIPKKKRLFNVKMAEETESALDDLDALIARLDLHDMNKDEISKVEDDVPFFESEETINKEENHITKDEEVVVKSDIKEEAIQLEIVPVSNKQDEVIMTPESNDIINIYEIKKQEDSPPVTPPRVSKNKIFPTVVCCASCHRPVTDHEQEDIMDSPKTIKERRMKNEEINKLGTVPDQPNNKRVSVCIRQYRHDPIQKKHVILEERVPGYDTPVDKMNAQEEQKENINTPIQNIQLHDTNSHSLDKYIDCQDNVPTQDETNQNVLTDIEDEVENGTNYSETKYNELTQIIPEVDKSTRFDPDVTSAFLLNCINEVTLRGMFCPISSFNRVADIMICLPAPGIAAPMAKCTISVDDRIDRLLAARHIQSKENHAATTIQLFYRYRKQQQEQKKKKLEEAIVCRRETEKRLIMEAEKRKRIQQQEEETKRIIEEKERIKQIIRMQQFLLEKKRNKSALIIQCAFRKYVACKRMKELHRKRLESIRKERLRIKAFQRNAAICIQKTYRGYIERQNWAMKKIELKQMKIDKEPFSKEEVAMISLLKLELGEMGIELPLQSSELRALIKDGMIKDTLSRITRLQNNV